MIPIPDFRATPRDTSQDDVAVSPRHLAGSGDYPDDAFAPLTADHWRRYRDDTGNSYAISDTDNLQIAYLPDLDENWQLDARAYSGAPWGQLWTATFSIDTPTEFVTAVTTTLHHDLGAGPQRRQRVLRADPHDKDDDPDNVWEVLRTAHWRVATRRCAITATSPDGLVEIHYRADGAFVPPREAWTVTAASTRDDPFALWDATFHEATPPHLITAFTQALTAPHPLTRHSAQLARTTAPYARPLRTAA
ncbi:DUF317 domain-containing protein [Streptomyces profundus]|uniref:DUF317 domain-containing protein n=1 Tax=Streptomyces profundus TaxID=2867410 RepID=UPI001D160F56|nr:DUF317 domain-containing protein [Streptomyces sp. MA3_2.13]UED86340.1 DUF317 domain-containing protein [Streptomyces sp. MA3_2.13]